MKKSKLRLLSLLVLSAFILLSIISSIPVIISAESANTDTKELTSTSTQLAGTTPIPTAIIGYFSVVSCDITDITLHSAKITYTVKTNVPRITLSSLVCGTGLPVRVIESTYYADPGTYTVTANVENLYSNTDCILLIQGNSYARGIFNSNYYTFKTLKPEGPDCSPTPTCPCIRNYIYTLKASDISSTSVAFNAYIDSYFNVYFNYWEKNNPKNINTVIVSTEKYNPYNNNNVIKLVEGLKPDTEYCYQVANDYDSNIETFKTLPQDTGIIYGDVNGDNTVNSADYTYMRKYLLGIIKSFPAPNWKTTGDVNLDGTIDSADYSVLRKFLLDKIDKLPYVINN